MTRHGQISLYLILGCVVVCLICLAIIARNWGCRPVRPEHTYTEKGTVVSVWAANQFIIQQRRRERAVTIQYIVVSGDPAGVALAKELLPIGSDVSVLVQGRRLLGNEADSSQRRLDENLGATAEAPEARGPFVGVVTASNGADVGLALVTEGLADVTADAPKDYKAAAKAAKRKGE
jgi:hypothetical protein